MRSFAVIGLASTIKCGNPFSPFFVPPNFRETSNRAGELFYQLG